MPALTEAEVDHYRSQGYCVQSGVLDAQTLGCLRSAVESAADSAVAAVPTGQTYHLDGKRFVDINEEATVQFEFETGSETVRGIETVHQLHPALDALLDDPRITEPAAQLVGATSISVWTNKLNLKRAREGSGFGWHQDAPYWMHDATHLDQLPNVMVTLDDADRDNGCFAVIARSHLGGILPGCDDGSQLGGFYTSPRAFNEDDRVDFCVEAGSLVFFDPYAVHGSGPNTSDRARRALVLTYQPGDLPMLKSGKVRNVRTKEGIDNER